MAEIFYEELINEFKSNLRTTDIDFYYSRIRKPDYKVDFLKFLKDRGYIILEDYTGHDTKGRTVIINTEKFVEIEFLTKLHRNTSRVGKIESLNIYAQSIEHLNLFDSNNISFISEKCGVKVTIPAPETYVLQKMIINELRDKDKKEKDIRALENIYPFLDIDKLKETYLKLSKKQKKKVLLFLKENPVFDSDIILGELYKR